MVGVGVEFDDPSGEGSVGAYRFGMKRDLINGGLDQLGQHVGRRTDHHNHPVFHRRQRATEVHRVAALAPPVRVFHLHLGGEAYERTQIGGQDLGVEALFHAEQ